MTRFEALVGIARRRIMFMTLPHDFNLIINLKEGIEHNQVYMNWFLVEKSFLVVYYEINSDVQWKKL